MIFSRKINILEIACVLIFICCCMVMAYDVNTRFPNAKVITNDETDYIEWAGCKIQALEKRIYTVEEFSRAYPDNDEFRYLENRDSDGYGIVVYKVAVTNQREKAVDFYMPIQAIAVAWPSTWHNGMVTLSGSARIEPGSTNIIETIAMYAPSLVHFTEQEEMRNNEFELVFSFYPERVVLRFD